ncbi:MAG: PolC-type DNA polymerase III, partial [Erysipelotrichaceae bacterium]
MAKEQNCFTLKDLQNHSESLNFKKAKEFHIILLAKNADGLKSLFELITLSHTERLLFNAEEESINEPSLLRSDIISKRKNLLLGSSCYNSEIFEIAMNRSQRELEEKMLFYDYIEVQALANYSPLLENHNLPNIERLQTIIKNIITTAERLNILVLATGDVHYTLKHEKIFRDIYINAKGIGKSRHPLYLYQEERRLNNISPDQHFRTTDEMLECFDFLEKDEAYRVVVTNTNLIANRIEIIYPIRDSLYTSHIDNAEENLKETVLRNATDLYGNPLPMIVKNRLDKELNSIITHGFSVIYYIAHLLVKKSLDDGYMVGSRGSVGSSLVATMAKITEVNPLPPHYVCPKCQFSEFFDDGNVDSGYDLPTKKCPKCTTILLQDGQDIPFETFLGFEGDKVPDIDLNFSSEYQDKAHAYTKVLFGDKHVFRAGTITTVADKTAFGYVKGYVEELKIDKPYTSAYRTYLAHGAGGVKRTSGQHPGGIIVIPQDMDVHDFTPVQYPANKINADWLTTHFEFADLHDNVLKLDILGHVDPSAMKMLENLTKINIQSIPMNDSKTISIFSSTKNLKCDSTYLEKTGAVGLPEFGTNFVRQILEATQPKDFSDLVRISGLSHGKEVWSNNARDLIKDGLKLNEVIGCRDDIMVYLIHKGLSSKQAFDIMESVRKGRGLKEEWKKLMLDKHVPSWYIDSCQRIKYMFPKAHAVAYVLMAVRVAWFKIYYPN